RELLQALHRLLAAAREGRRLRLGADAGEHRDVGAHDEAVRLAAREDDRLYLCVAVEPREDPGELLFEIRPQRVHRLAGHVHEDGGHAARLDVETKSGCRHSYSRVRMHAPPRPPAAQMEMSAELPLRAASSRSAWWTSRAPVAANGCPRLIDPPLGLSFPSGTSPAGSAPARCSSAKALEAKACRLERTCAANASWISTRSRSASFIPARRSTLGTENAGAWSSCQAGSTAAYAYSRR